MIQKNADGNWYSNKKLPSIEDDLIALGLIKPTEQEKLAEDMLNLAKEAKEKYLNPNTRSLITEYSGDAKRVEHDLGKIQEDVKQFGVSIDELKELAAVGHDKSGLKFMNNLNGSEFSYSGSVGVVGNVGTGTNGGNVTITGGCGGSISSTGPIWISEETTTTGDTRLIGTGTVYPNMYPGYQEYKHIHSPTYDNQLSDMWAQIMKLVSEKDELIKKISALEFNQTQQKEQQEQVIEQLAIQLKDKELDKQLTEADQKLLIHWQEKFGSSEQVFMKELLIDAKRINNVLNPKKKEPVKSSRSEDDCLRDIYREVTGNFDQCDEEIDNTIAKYSDEEYIKSLVKKNGWGGYTGGIHPSGLVESMDYVLDTSETALGVCLQLIIPARQSVSNQNKELQKRICRDFNKYYPKLTINEKDIVKDALKLELGSIKNRYDFTHFFLDPNNDTSSSTSEKCSVPISNFSSDKLIHTLEVPADFHTWFNKHTNYSGDDAKPTTPPIISKPDRIMITQEENGCSISAPKGFDIKFDEVASEYPDLPSKTHIDKTFKVGNQIYKLGYPIDSEYAKDIKPGDTVWTKSGKQGPLIVLCEALTTHKFKTLDESGERRIEAFICRDSKGKDSTFPLVDLSKEQPKKGKFAAWLPVALITTLMLSFAGYKAYNTPAITDFVKGKYHDISGSR